jgi:alanine or glycine:cation symporter, AGCS family
LTATLVPSRRAGAHGPVAQSRAGRHSPPATLAARFGLAVATICASTVAHAAPATGNGLDESINTAFKPVADAVSWLVFHPVPIGFGASMPFVVLWLLIAAVFCTVYFGFVNVRGFAQGFRLIRGDYSRSDDPGEVTHFQALATALSGTVGLGNIAGVAIAISIGGPGATFWMIVAGLLGMSRSSPSARWA